MLTVSDTRTRDTDTTGAMMCDLLTAAGHRVASHDIIPDDPAIVRQRVERLGRDRACHAVLLTGGTGLSARDSTYEAVAGLLVKRLDGFGELFRMLSYDAIGPAAMLSRAVAGVCHGTVVFSMPGAGGAVRLALEKLILPEIEHIVWLLRRDDG